MNAKAAPQAALPAPLAGICVLDLSRLLPGPLCGQHLADLGARVIKIEDPKIGDYVRPSIRKLANRGKEGLTLDLKSDEGHAIFLKLVDTADVVLESFRPGVMARLGLGYQELSCRRPSIVYCSITGYGQTGKRRDAAGHDINYLALSGVLDQTGRRGQPPVIPGFLISDILGGTMTAPLEGIQTVTVPAGGAVAAEFKLDVPGNYTLVDHAIARMERGLLGVLHVEGPPNPDIFNGEVMPGMGH